ncbi:MAG: hypothetical protein VX689_01835 [Bacteroidota bacterium]|nr:hypothetical protein [Bacteroidota bacterium]|tara:strand:+ start:211 stop:522 length:312 start_codon:yes stop_codon:yes gene_type:complete
MRYSVFLLFLLCSCTYNELVPICEPDSQTFSEVVQPIIEAKCIFCHNESSGRPALLTTYDGVIDAINNHSLKNEVVGLQMPPYGSSPLSIVEINIIQNWIDCE